MTAHVRPIVILGPTAGGKSELAVRLAEQLAGTTGKPGQIIGADSMQVYKHMHAGTAKPSPNQRARALHHLIDLVEPTERFTVTDWLEQADALIERLIEQRITPIVVGGTNLYIKALLEGLFEGPPHDAELREQLKRLDNAALHARLLSVDPRAGQRIHPNDRKRMVRAIEVFEQTGKPISALQTQWESDKGDSDDSSLADPVAQSLDPAKPYRHNPLLIGLQWSADEINPRINLRVKAMFFPEKVDAALAAEVTPIGESLPDETARLESAGLLGPQAREALGYKQVLAAMQGDMTMEDAYERTKILTRRFAKQQRTWLKRFRGVRWIECPSDDVVEQALAVVISESLEESGET